MDRSLFQGGLSWRTHVCRKSFTKLRCRFCPPESEPGPKGGRRAVGHHTVLKVIWFVLVTGCRWKDVPQEIGCCGETGRTRLQAWERTGIWSEIHHLLLAMLNHEKQLHLETAIIDSTQVHMFGGGEATGAEPRGSPEKRDEIHAAGRSRRRSPRDSGGCGESQRPSRDSADRDRLSARRWQAGTPANASGRIVCRCGLRLRSHSKRTPLAGNRAAYSAPRWRTRQSPWSSTLGCRAHS